MGTLDILIIIAYLTIVLAVGFIFSRQQGESGKSQYFLAGRNVGWIAVGASIFATNISSEHFIGLAGSGAAHGLAVSHFEWMAVFVLILLGWVFVPIYWRLGIYTVPEFLEKRYNLASRMYLTGVTIVAYILTKMSIMLFAGGLVLHTLLGWDLYTSAVVMIVLTGVYTIIGGLSAVIYTQVIQAIFIIGGALALSIAGLHQVGGFSGLKETLPAGYFTIIKPMSDPNFPWTGILFGAPILAVWYWCADQYIVQRVLSAKNISQAQSGTLLAAFLKLLPVLLLVVPGMTAAALYPEVRGDEAYASLMTSLALPFGLRGLVITGILAALMSSLASVFNSASTLFTIDIFSRFHPHASERKLVLVGRLGTTMMVITAILWVPLTKLISENIYIYLQSVQAYISPPIAAVLLLGVFSRRCSGRGAIISLISGGIIGAFRLILELISRRFTLDLPLLNWFIELNYLHFAVFLFVVSTAILVLVSRLEHWSMREDGVGMIIHNGWRAAGLVSGQFITGIVIRRNIVLSVFLIMVILGLWGVLL
ncbi:MAG: sodium/solute symporter [Caldithrix sp.]|nr:sodium/solute symporter [Caldithrix sp.]